MPYIKKKYKPAIDEKIGELVDVIKAAASQEGDYNTAFPGFLNYTCTRLALKLIPARRYWAIAMVSGVFSNIADEFYRRLAAPYENEQIAKNGDVYPPIPND